MMWAMCAGPRVHPPHRDHAARSASSHRRRKGVIVARASCRSSIVQSWPGIEVSTTGIKVLLAGFGLFPSLAMKLLVSHGIVESGADGKPLVVQERWFPLDAWLGVLDAIEKEIGPAALFKVGENILENPKFP